MTNKPLLFAIICILSLFGNKLLAQQFTEQTNISLPDIYYGAVAWGDYDNDGDLDILLTGYSLVDSYTKIYKNDGSNSFTEQTNISLPSVYNSSLAWGDYDNDGDLDVLLTGVNPDIGDISKIYKNNGNNSFTEQSQISIESVSSSSVAWGDYDNDGDLDFLLTGYGNSGLISKIYKNDGGNSFIEQTNISVEGVGNSSVAWGDYDNDGDLDILLTGYASAGAVSKIYKNNGNNNFIEQTGISLVGVGAGSVAWGDYDNDGDLDILLAGDTDNGNITKIYKNNGNNSFSDQTDIILDGITDCSASWGDYDNDGYLDIMLTGDKGQHTSEGISKIYKNNGNNSFTEQTNISITDVSACSSAWGDYDNDGDLDILLTGYVSNDTGVSKIYKNNNAISNIKPNTISNPQATINGNQVTFSWNTAIDPNQAGGLNYNLYVYDLGSSAYANPAHSFRQTDVQNGKRLIAKIGNIQKNSHTLSLISGNYTWSVQAVDAGFQGGSFAQEQSLLIEGVGISPLSKQFTNTNQNGNTLIVAETHASSQREWKYSTTPGGPYQSLAPTQAGLQYTPNFKIHGNYYVICESVISSKTYYSNEVEIEVSVDWFTEQKDIYLVGNSENNVSWADYDNDGDLDILLSNKVYKNNGGNNFVMQTDIHLLYPDKGCSAWGDYDNDGDLDILYAGDKGTFNGISLIYRNDGNNSFVEQTSISITGVYSSSVAWGDYDNDGDLDILLTGFTVGEFPVSKIFENNGNNVFVELAKVSLTGVYDGSAEWADYDNDGDLDILLTGLTSNKSDAQTVSKIFKNNGDKSFTEQTQISLTGVRNGSVAWGDYDNDGDLDILLTGDTTPYSWLGISKIYKNNGNNNFIEQSNINLPNIFFSSAAWGDYDNDGYLDILIAGRDNNNTEVSEIFKNNGNGDFEQQTNISLTGTALSSVAWGDYDNDGDLDILLTGNVGLTSVSKIYKNNADIANSSPDMLTNLQETVNGNQVVFSWGTATDNNQSNGLSYNLYVYDLDSAIYSNPSHAFRHADAKNGKRLIAQIGKIQKNSHALVLKAGNYAWSVQSVDATLSGGKFATEKNFTVEGVRITPGSKQKIEPGKDGVALVASETHTVTKREWKYSKTTGGAYQSFSPAQTGLTYKPNFLIPGHTYIICESIINSTTYVSNEVDIEIPWFTEMKDISLAGVYYSCADWGDYDKDGDLDILLSGDTGTKKITKIYKNDGNNSFSEQTSISIVQLSNSAATWGDYDNDGDLDILLCGNTGATKVTKIYKNVGNNSFAEQTGISLIGIEDGSLAWGDYDNDGDLDILLSGSHSTKIYKNYGNYQFAELIQISLAGVEYASAVWGDYDNDGDLDILLSGQTDIGRYILNVYDNNGDNNFTKKTDLSLIENHLGKVAWGDYDNDGDLDILLGGVSKIYKNNGDNSFTEQTSISLIKMDNVAWFDYDNDGNLDILLNGSHLTKIYKNNGNNRFTEQTDIVLARGFYGSTAVGDYDNDGDLDILITGWGDDLKKFSKIYKNNNAKANIKPSVLSNLQESINGFQVTFTWNKGSDLNQTGGLSYNLYVYDVSGNFYLNPAQAFKQSDVLNGKRLIARIGNIQKNSHTLLLPKGNYAWSVQAIDASMDGGNFSNEKQFSIIPESLEVLEKLGIKIYPNPVKDIVNIDFANNQVQEIKLTDASGKTIFSKTKIAQSEKIDFSKFEIGIYILTIQSNKGIFAAKLIKH